MISSQVPHFTSRIEISIQCRKISDVKDINTIAILSTKDDEAESYAELGRTETVRSYSPAYKTKLKIEYCFFMRQKIRIEIHTADGKTFDNATLLGRFDCVFGELINRKEVESLLGSEGSIKLICDEVEACKEAAVIQMEGKQLDKKDVFGKSDPFVEIFYAEDDTLTLNSTGEPEGESKYVLSHRTEVIKCTLDPLWGVARVPLIRMCAGDRDRVLRFDVYDWDSDKSGALPSDPKKPHHMPTEQRDTSNDYIGCFYTTVNDLENKLLNSKPIFEVICSETRKKKKAYKNSGTILFKRITIDIEQTFLDYIFGGTDLNFAVALDFSKTAQPSQYETLVKFVGQIIQDYDFEKKFPAVGFSANIPVNVELAKCFPLRMEKETMFCSSINSITKAISAVRVEPAPVPKCTTPLKEIAKLANAQMDGSVYYVLLMIVSAPIADLDYLVDVLVDASTVPLSVIIISVGAEDQRAMSTFDSDRLRSGRKVSERDNVQYFHLPDYIKHNLSPETMLMKALADVPYQLVEWMRRRVIIPLPPRTTFPALKSRKFESSKSKTEPTSSKNTSGNKKKGDKKSKATDAEANNNQLKCATDDEENEENSNANSDKPVTSHILNKEDSANSDSRGFTTDVITDSSEK